MLTNTETYSRKNDILYDSKGNKILKFLQHTVDTEKITADLFDNLNNFINKFPERVEIFNDESSEMQLTLF